MITLTSSMPPMNPEQFVWASLGNSNTERIIFNLLGETNRTVKLADHIICNTSYELEPAALALFPEILPIGPLLADHQIGNLSGYFWPADASCLAWLDKQPEQSVIYVAFGSTTIFDQIQFEELALGLEAVKRPLLWVVRPDTMDEKSDMFLKAVMGRIGKHGRIVGWTHQQDVLNHPSVGCFLSHCGWNSTMEGVSNGVPFLCWPYFADQFLNETYICNVWKVGLSLDKDATGIVTRREIMNKVEKLFSDKAFKERALIHQEMVMRGTQDNGCSNKNMSNFIEWMRM
ncbi:UDP-glycosyltransferase 83A1-like [Apium graveolens]|uniref:UDP-glycosyltransferase 83A1-like n=1 Tax=Apium graveolens TaxID=4045 RepID=UPI003D78D444